LSWLEIKTEDVTPRDLSGDPGEKPSAVAVFERSIQAAIKYDIWVARQREIGREVTPHLMKVVVSGWRIPLIFGFAWERVEHNWRQLDNDCGSD